MLKGCASTDIEGNWKLPNARPSKVTAFEGDPVAGSHPRLRCKGSENRDPASVKTRLGGGCGRFPCCVARMDASS
jgi:hypothetical protein